MKELKEEFKYSRKGITLIALVITIIVLLILAAVSIATLTGDNGILTRAQEAKNKTEEAQEKESLELAITSSKIEDTDTLVIEKEKLENAIKEQFGNNKDFSVTDNKDGSFLVNMNDTKRMYYVDEKGELIDQSKILKISKADELKAFRDDVNSGNTYEGWYVYLENDITLDGYWVPIGFISESENENITSFNGIFDGCGYEIDGILIDNKESYQGFFANVVGGTIKNIGIGENSNIKCQENGAGSIVARAFQAKIINCYNKSNIEGTTSVGGLVGVLNSNSKIINCYNSGNVKGTTFNVGGVVGNSMSSQIINCYNTGSIEAIRPAGISGQSLQKSIIKNCYNIGNVTKIEGDTRVNYSHYGIVAVLHEEDKINNCYYLNGSVNKGNDIDECEGVINKTSEELKLLYSILGKSFRKDTNNINNGYPILSWQ